MKSDDVHRILRDEILSGDLAPGDAVPSERVLSERLGVNRHAVREALKRLQQAGLVQISQGGATRVRDWRATGGLDLLLELALSEALSTEMVQAVLEAREAIGIDAARRAAARAAPAERAAIADAARACAQAVRAQGPRDEPAYEALWAAIVVASGNLAWRLALNTLLAAVGADDDVAAAMWPQDPDAVAELGEAIGAGDVASTEAAARRLLEPAARWARMR